MPEHRACDATHTTLKPERVQLRLAPAGGSPPAFDAAELDRLRRAAAGWRGAAAGGLTRTFQLPGHPQAVLFTTAAHSLAEVVGLGVVAAVEGSRVHLTVTAAGADGGEGGPGEAPAAEPDRRSLAPGTHPPATAVLLGALACDAAAGLWGAEP